MSLPKVSVLLPVYNTPEQSLRECIDGILKQTFSDFELIIVNDCSSDKNVEKVIRTYTDPRIRYYENGKNLGISDTRNKLIELATAEYLAIHDHDDISLPQRFEKQVAYLDEHPNVGLISCQVEIFPKLSYPQNPIESHDIKLEMVGHCCMFHSACMIRKSVLDENNLRYESQYTPAEDYALFCRLLKKTDFYNLPEILFRYRDDGKNTSHTQNSKMFYSTCAIKAFTTVEAPDLVEEFEIRSIKIKKYRLFGFLPILKIVDFDFESKILLFGKIPLLTVKKFKKFTKKIQLND